MSSEQSPRLSFRAVEVFVAVTEQQSVTGAAKRLGASPSSVSSQLTNLESSLGTRLIERSAQRFALTKAGEIFRSRALRILDEIDGAKAALADTERSPSMTLRIAVIEDFDAEVLPAWLRQLSIRFPNCRFIVKSGPSHENHSALASRAVDVIVSADTIEPADYVESHALLRDPHVLIGAFDGFADAGLDILLQKPFMRYSREQYMGRQIKAQLRRTGLAPASGFEFSSNQALFAMVTTLRGWAVTTATALSAAPGVLEHNRRRPAVIARQLPFPAFSREIHLFSRRDVLGDMPIRFAAALRNCLDDRLVKPTVGALPFLEGELYVLNN
ncbi:MAG: LysR family transcriptional regulator [Proteobacteria bacterium]|nr:LysR family transcriptional regulator [Pseudomonadota bacterium]